MTTQVMDIVRGKFLEKQLNCLYPEIVSIIRDYDDIYKNYFSKKIISSLQVKVYIFWKNKSNQYAMNNTISVIDFTEGSVYSVKMKYYCNILWYVIIIPKISEINKYGGLSQSQSQFQF